MIPNNNGKRKPLQFKRGTSSAFKFVNPVLLDGQPAFEIDTFKLKIGDGRTEYNLLPYIAGETVGGGKSAFDLWKEVEGNENKTLDDFFSDMKTTSWGYF